jgi:hypothetical protein
MKTFVRLVIKVLANNELRLLAENNILPEMELGDKPDITAQIIDFVKNEYNLLPTVCQPRLLNVKLISGTLLLYYDFYYPKDYIDEKTIDKVVNVGNKFLDEDAIEIRQSIQVSPYQFL